MAVTFTMMTFALRGYPLLDNDGVAFLPVAMNWLNHGSFSNPGYGLAHVVDQTGQARFVYHGFLYPMLLAGIGGVFPRVPDLASLSGMLLALWFPATAYLFYRAAMIMRSKFGWVDVIVCVLGLLTLASVAVSINGRPETLATLIVALGGSIVLSMQVPPMQSYRGLAEGLILGIAVGLCAATSPIVGIGTAGLGPVIA